MFFKIHGQIQYEINGIDMPMTDITKSSVVLNESKLILQSVDVANRTPEQLSDDLYGTPMYFWTILLINNVIDPFTDWYMIEDHLYDYTIRLYGEENILKVRYFRDTVKEEIVTGDDDARYREMMDNDEQLPEHIEYVTNLDHEKILNNLKKTVKVIPKLNINQFVENTKSALRGQI